MLLNTFDIDVLQQVLYFMIRPAQRLNNPKAIRSSFTVPQDKIIELIRGWNQVSTDLLSIAQDRFEITSKMLTLSLQFYRTSDNNTEEGLQTIIYTFNEQELTKTDTEIFIQLVNEYNVPKENQFELANRIRIIKHLNQPVSRRQLLSIRVLSIAIMGRSFTVTNSVVNLRVFILAHGVSENIAHNKVFIYEPHLITQLAELISPENDVDMVKQQLIYVVVSFIKKLNAFI